VMHMSGKQTGQAALARVERTQLGFAESAAGPLKIASPLST
jgi:hypothetical protein